MLKLAWQLALWFHRTLKDPGYIAGPFIPPQPPRNESEELHIELTRLNVELQQHKSTQAEITEQLQAKEALLQEAKQDASFWETMAAQVERDNAALQSRLHAVQQTVSAQPASTRTTLAQSATAAVAGLVLDEAETRALIDEQLRQAGWEADTQTLRYGLGVRPQKGRNMAIAEWPAQGKDRADYVLFVGCDPLAVVEAKRKNVDVSAALQQAKRYSRGFAATEETILPGDNWGEHGEFRIPFVFSANGRPYLQQLRTKSGIWFCDLRDPSNHGRPLDNWYTPDGLQALLKRNEAAAHASLQTMPFHYGFTLRDYQEKAIRAVEDGLAEGRREILLAMATGTGKTKTCIALLYRLLRAERFRRILFLVDRAALGEQAANAFKDTRMENLLTFNDIHGIMELDDKTPDSSTKVHIATVQGMVQRVMYASEEAPRPAVDQYDCIVVDECHRGYLLDRELSDTELTFRGFQDYISKYRRVLDYFDAVRIGLTATPALHTTEIFDAPIFTYGYREAVIDGYLIDYEPPVQIITTLSKDGITYKVGEKVTVFHPKTSTVTSFNTPDEIKLDVQDFNRKVITEPFNRVVCQYLASQLDPASGQKTLIFCATDPHADLVVALLKEAMAETYGSVDDDAVIKITGTADKPLELIRRFKNEQFPNIAVTVDLLTTGVDVPTICNLVFLRRVNSRILFDQMIGRATRLCPEIGKEVFRIFDAVRIFENLQDFTDMRPVVINPKRTFAELGTELTTVADDEARALVRDQFVAKLQRRKRQLTEKGRQNFEALAGMSPEAFVAALKDKPLDQVAAWFTSISGLGEILDRQNEDLSIPIYVSNHQDSLHTATHGFGDGQRPEDYLQAFQAFIRANANTMPALITVLTRPRELTRKQLRELAMSLDSAGFSEAKVTTAWRDMTNEDIAARIVGFIRQAAIGDPLQSYEERVERALRKIMSSRTWTPPQREWLKRIAAQTKANTLVDRDALDDPNLLFKREGGGFTRLDRIFAGQLEQVLADFNDALWSPGKTA
jgi:type I restriction enzyme R subunit